MDVNNNYSSSKINVFEWLWEDVPVNEYAWLKTIFRQGRVADHHFEVSLHINVRKLHILKPSACIHRSDRLIV